MIPNSTLNIASNSLSTLLKSGGYIAPSGHILTSLNAKTLPPSQMVITSDEQLANSINLLPELSNNELHHTALFDAAQELKIHLDSSLSFVHGVAKPETSKFVTAYADYLTGIKETDPASQISIVQRMVPDLAHNTFVGNSFSTTANYVDAAPGIGKHFSLGEITDVDALIEFLKFNQVTLDRDIAAWALSSPAVMPLFKVFFGSGGTYKGISSIREARALNSIDLIDAGLLIGLVAFTMEAKVREDQTHLNLTKYQQACEEHKDFASMLFKAGMDQQVFIVKMGKVVETMNPATKVIEVNSPIYTDWLTNQNGKPEILMGAFVSGDYITNISVLNDKSIQLLKVWDSFCSMSRLQFESRLSTTVRGWLSIYMHNAIDQFSASTDLAIYKQDAYKVDAKAVVQKKIDELDEKILTDVWDVALILVAGGMFFNSCAYDILMDVHRIGEKNPNIDALDAVSIASIRYLSDYISTMMKLVKA